MTFEQVYKKYHRTIFSYALKRTRSRDEAEELTQDIFIKVHRFLGTYREDMPFERWLWRLMRNAVIDWKRSVILERETLVDDQDASLVSKSPTKEPNPYSRLAARSERSRILSALQVLTVLQRKVVWLRFVHDLSMEEIAEEMSVTVASVKCVLYRARDCFKEGISSGKFI